MKFVRISSFCGPLVSALAMTLVTSVAAGAEPTPASAVAPADTRKAEAASRFDRALKLFEAGDNAGALAEFKRTYEVFPDPVVLYNMGLVYAAMSRPVDSVDALEPLVKSNQLQGGQMERAKQTLADQLARIGRLTVVTKPSDARIEIDGVEVSSSGGSPIRVSEGKHIVGAVVEGYAPARKEIFIAGNADATVSLELIPTVGKQLGNLTVRTRIADAEVFVDGKSVGKTPLPTSVPLPPGRHQVELRRRGYASVNREIEVGPGSTGEIEAELEVDSTSLDREGVTLVIDASESPFEVTIDGKRQGVYKAPLRLPAGAHHLSVTSAGFISHEKEITLGGTQTNLITVTLEPTPETRKAYESNANAHRTWGWIGVLGGTAIAAGGTVFALVEHGKKKDAYKAYHDLVRKADLSEPPCDWKAGNDSQCDSLKASAKSDLDTAKTLRTVGIIGAGVGGAVLVTGIVVLATGGDPDKYAKRTAKSRLTVVPGPGEWGTGLSFAF